VAFASSDNPLPPSSPTPAALRPILVEPPPATEVSQQFIGVPQPDYLAEGFRQAMAAEVRSNPHYQEFAQRVQKMAKHIGDSLKMADRIAGNTRTPDVVVKP